MFKIDRFYLINWYNATSTDDGTGELETYENLLERQLISRINKITELENNIKSSDSEKPENNERLEQT
jgi:hypothetical protein